MMIFKESIAKICHEANRAYCQALGDNSQPPWNEAPLWQRQSAINGVKYIASHPEATPKDSHISWCKEKAEQGWVYGPIKDIDKKEHPCLVSYEDLPADQRMKDHLFRSIVLTLIQEV